MQIDWITAIAQAINFLVLVWLLHHFLYGRILDAVDRRDERVRRRLEEAEEKHEAAEQELAEYRTQLRELERERDEKMRQASAEAEEEKHRLREQARQEVDSLKQGWLRTLADDQDALRKVLRERSARQFFVLAQRALRDLADQDLSDQMCAAFKRQLEQLSSADRERLSSACNSAGNTVCVRTRFEPSSSVKRELTRALHQAIGEQVEVIYESSDDAALGVEAHCGSEIVSWNIQRYLEELEEQTLSALASEGEP